MKHTKIEKFLINRGLLEAFERNYSNKIKPFDKFLIDNDLHPMIICWAFNWSRSHEGWLFWGNLSAKWKECLENNTL